jgi:hypothetical protein
VEGYFFHNYLIEFLFIFKKEFMMIRVYVAGAYSGKNVLEILDNIRIGMRKGTEVLLAGFSPFVPWFDFHFQLMLKEDEKLTINHYYEYSIAWLKVSDVMLVLPNSENSIGTQNEIKIANEIGIPVYYNIEDIKTKYREL